jgi:hypothetical protein
MAMFVSTKKDQSTTMDLLLLNDNNNNNKRILVIGSKFSYLYVVYLIKTNKRLTHSKLPWICMYVMQYTKSYGWFNMVQ